MVHSGARHHPLAQVRGLDVSPPPSPSLRDVVLSVVFWCGTLDMHIRHPQWLPHVRAHGQDPVCRRVQSRVEAKDNLVQSFVRRPGPCSE